MAQITTSDKSNYRSDRGEHDRLDRMLDMALDLTFPGSDPVAITVSTNEPSDVPDMRNAGGKAKAK
ncbi:hypothetical protein SAMN05519103_08746 [Rhizobiales bacterium GAS113]|nr:hypothetical protein SAMN05519103_08746 [Rhizobiales bacterium GAS113]